MHITKVLGFDYGNKRIGIATGQTITGTATPCRSIVAVDGNPDWPAIRAEIKQWNPQALIVGIPYYPDGSESKMTKAARHFCYELKKRFKLPVIEVNEALSSVEAEEILRENIKITKHNKGEIDKMAAAIIVQNWLDQQT
jgi:putative Holliday junction resolvase